ncbi:DUF2705 family protein [Listeria grandensis]|nr:DUF2705 family protein [Listeria grandensis]
MVSHLTRIRKNNMSRIIILVIILFPLIEIGQLIGLRNTTGENFHPAFASFLSGASQGHITQILLLWFLPIYFLLVVSDDSIMDYLTGYRNILISKVGKKKYLLEKMITSFLVGFGVMAIALTLNVIITSVVFQGGDSMRGMEEMTFDDNTLFHFGITHRYIMAIIFIFITSFYTGLVSLLGASMSLLFLNKKLAYPATFFIWFFFILQNKSIMLLFQPFAEYGISDLLGIFIASLLTFIIIPILVYIYEARYAED